MEKTLGPVIHPVRHPTQLAAAVLRAVMILIAACIAGIAGSQTLQVNPADMLKNSGIGLPKAEVPPPAVPTAPEKIAQGYLYVEPYQARFEAMIDANRLLHWLNPLKDIPAELDAATQKAACEAATKQVQDWCRLSANGTRIEGSFIGVSVIKASLFVTVRGGFAPIPAVELKMFRTDSGLEVYTPHQGDQTWDAPLPSTPYPQRDLRYLAPDRPERGFARQ